MPGFPGAGFRFAVPDVMNLKTENWSQAVGAIAFGQQGEVFRVVGVNETAAGSQTWAVGQQAHLETATGAISRTSIFSALVPFIVGFSNTATDLFAGVFGRSGHINQLAWLQVAGPAIATLGNSAHASAENAYFLMVNNTGWSSTAAGAAILSLQSGGCAYNGGGHLSAQSTARLHLLAAQGLGLYNGKPGYITTT